MPKTILIVDDDTVSRGLIRMVLEYDGCRCLEAENGVSALAMVRQNHVDLMILDYMMPGITGIEVLTALQEPSKPLSPLCPATIMITGMLQQSIREKASELGAFAVLEKPYDLGQLRSLVFNIHEDMRSSERKVTPSPSTRPSSSPLS